MIDLDRKMRKLLNEMARADLKGAEAALSSKDWTTAAKKYIENAKARDMDDKKIVSGLGATFRKKADADTITIAKGIEMAPEDAVEFKKAVKAELGWKPAAKKKSPKKKKDGETKETPVDTKTQDALELNRRFAKGKKALLTKKGEVEEGVTYREIIAENAGFGSISEAKSKKEEEPEDEEIEDEINDEEETPKKKKKSKKKKSKKSKKKKEEEEFDDDEDNIAGEE